jgi:NAD(P)-dependent dehydrogenase (short-subunit alcohol dehydrogenase family)
MRKVIITGSSSGFGFKAAKDFADKGYQVFATMRNPQGKCSSMLFLVVLLPNGQAVIYFIKPQALRLLWFFIVCVLGIPLRP